MHRPLLLGLLAAALLSPANGLAATLTGKWRLASLEQLSSFDDTKTELVLQTDGRASMTVGCNRMNATVAIGEAGMKFGPIMATKMMCPPRVMTLEGVFQNAIGRTAAFKLEGETLQLLDASNSVVATFTRQK